MPSTEQAFDTLADTDLWAEAAAVGAGFLAPTLVRNVAEPNTGMDIPDEVYGLAVVVGGQYSPMYGDMITLGGAVYTTDKLLERLDMKQSIPGTGGA